MEYASWNELKNKRLKLVRGISFDEIIRQKVVAVEDHPKIENQKILLYEYKMYIWAVPYVEHEKGIFLKTIYPSRKHTKKYLKKGL